MQHTSVATFQLNNVKVAYDVKYELENNINGDATFLINFDNVPFNMEIKLNNVEKKSEGKLQFTSVGSARKNHPNVRIQSHPENPQLQLIMFQVSEHYVNIF